MYKIPLDNLVLEAEEAIQRGYFNSVKIIYNGEKPRQLIELFEKRGTPYSLAGQFSFRDLLWWEKKYSLDLTKIEIDNEYSSL